MVKFIPSSSSKISGLGDKVMLIVDGRTNEELGYTGRFQGRDVVHLTRPIPVDQLVSITNQFKSGV